MDVNRRTLENEAHQVNQQQNGFQNTRNGSRMNFTPLVTNAFNIFNIAYCYNLSMQMLQQIVYGMLSLLDAYKTFPSQTNYEMVSEEHHGTFSQNDGNCTLPDLDNQEVYIENAPITSLDEGPDVVSVEDDLPEQTVSLKSKKCSLKSNTPKQRMARKSTSRFSGEITPGSPPKRQRPKRNVSKK